MICIKVFLKLVESELITFLKFLIVWGVLLIAIIGQMDEFIFVIKWIVIRASSHVTSLVEVEIVLIGPKSKDSNIKLSTIKEQRFLHILLNDPQLVSWLRREEMSDLLKRGKDLYAFALVHVCWFHQPNVLLKLLGRESLIVYVPSLNIVEFLFELMKFRVTGTAWYDKS